jgi:hypothetical protein
MIADDPTEDVQLVGQRIDSPALIRRFVLAGRAMFTIKSLATGKHYSYRVARVPQRDESGRPPPFIWFVSVRTSGDNLWEYMGNLEGEHILTFRLTGRTRHLITDERYLAFDWFRRKVLEGGTVPNTLEVWHEGRCAACGRPLSDPSSITRGFGPDCAERLGIT